MGKIRTFYILMLTQIISLIGSRMTGIAIGIWVYARTGDAAPVLLAAFFAELPQMALGVIGGALADKWNRRWVIMLGDAGQALGTILLLLSIYTESFQLWHLYGVMLIQGIFATLQSPAAEASIAMLVPEAHLDRANGIRQIGFPLAGVIAPALAGMLYSIGGLDLVIAVDLISFVVAVVVVFRLHIPQPEQSEMGAAASANIWSELLGGWHFLRAHGVLLALTLYMGLVFFLINGPLDMAIPYLSNLAGDEAVLGVLLSMMSLGAFAGAGFMAVFGRIKHRVPLLIGGYLVHGVMLILYGVTRDVTAIGVILFVLMFPLALGNGLFSTIIQMKTPPDMQGRVFAMSNQLFTLTTPLSFLLTAWLVDNVLEPAVATEQWQVVAPLVGSEVGAGMGLLLVIVGVMIVGISLLMLANRKIRQLEQIIPNHK